MMRVGPIAATVYDSSMLVPFLHLSCMTGAYVCGAPVIISAVFCSSPVGTYPNRLTYITTTSEASCSLSTEIVVPPAYALIYSQQSAFANVFSSYAPTANGFDLMIGATGVSPVAL